MIKLLAIDLDGTLLNNNHTISSENLKAIRIAQDNGIKVIIATGRPEQLVKEYVEQLKMEDPLIMYNGSVIGHPFMDDVLYKKVLSEETIKSVVSHCVKQDLLFMIYTKDVIISAPNYRVDFFLDKNKNLSDKNKAVFKDIRDMNEILSYDVHKILLIEHDLEKYQQAYQFAVGHSDVSVVRSSNGFIDINPHNTSKGIALEFYAKELGIKQEEVASIGDQDNDVSMLKYAGLSISMGNASESALKEATHQSLSNDENGVAVAIMKYIVKK